MTARPVGPWPASPPWQGPARVGVLLDGSLASLVCAHWVERLGADWVPIVQRANEPAARKAEQAANLSGRAGTQLGRSGAFTDPLIWSLAASAAQGVQASWLAVGLRTEAAEPPVALRLHAAETALTLAGLPGLYAPLLGWPPEAVGRLALALGVPLELSWDCEREALCGVCEGCVERAAMFKQLGLPDPLLG